MSENTKKTQITIDDVEYAYEDLTQEQQHLFNHCLDLDRKIGSAMEPHSLFATAVGSGSWVLCLMADSVRARPQGACCTQNFPTVGKLPQEKLTTAAIAVVVGFAFAGFASNQGSLEFSVEG